MVINIKTATTKKDKGKCFSIRRDVFVKEQNISKKIEFDDEKVDATYFIAQYNNIFVGTARYRFTDLGIKLERFAVLKSYRNLGIGKELVLYILNSIKDKKLIYLHAQESVIDFYSRLGFKRIGSQFFEAEIPHQKMIYNHRYK
tara:strand:+ start:175 stop:606 length:432 start_codon:yes stop_codon:yes gene_type:complete